MVGKPPRLIRQIADTVGHIIFPTALIDLTVHPLLTEARLFVFGKASLEKVAR